MADLFINRVSRATERHPPRENSDALEALQSEIELHREDVANSTYFDIAISAIYDAGRAGLLRDLETARDMVQNNSNSLPHSEIVNLIERDRISLQHRSNVDSALGAVAGSLAYFGGTKGKLTASALLALNNMHPRDSIAKQTLDGSIGLALGTLAGKGFDRGRILGNSALGLGLQGLSYPLAAQLCLRQSSSQIYPSTADAERIYKINKFKIQDDTTIH